MTSLSWWLVRGWWRWAQCWWLNWGLKVPKFLKSLGHLCVFVFNEDFVVHCFANVLQFSQLYSAASCFRAGAVAINLPLVYLHSTCNNPFLSVLAKTSCRKVPGWGGTYWRENCCQAVGQLSCKPFFFFKDYFKPYCDCLSLLGSSLGIHCLCLWPFHLPVPGCYRWKTSKKDKQQHSVRRAFWSWLWFLVHRYCCHF